MNARAASAAWERAVLNARGRIVFVSGGPGCGSDDGFHPLAHGLAPALDRIATRVGLETALRLPSFMLAGTLIERCAVETRALPGARFEWTVPNGFAARLADTSESATSLENLFSCQLMWALRHVARLRPGRVRSIPDANQLLGNLAHAIAREIFAPGAPPGRGEAERRTVELLEDRIDQLAAPLRHPEFAEELNFARRRVPSASDCTILCPQPGGRSNAGYRLEQLLARVVPDWIVTPDKTAPGLPEAVGVGQAARLMFSRRHSIDFWLRQVGYYR